MNILILTLGTRGDVQPYVALGRGLVAAGHAVTIGTCARFREFVEEHGLNYAFMNDDLLEFMHSDDGKKVMENAGNLWEMARVAFTLMPRLRSMQRRQLTDSWESTRAVRPDLILYHPKALGGRDFAERLDVPCMLAFYLPMYVPSGEMPAVPFPKLRAGGWYNRLTYRLIARTTWWGTGKAINAWRLANDLPARRGGNYLLRTNGGQIPALHAYSEAVLPRPADWPATATVTGYWFLDRLEAWQPPNALSEFLARGEPPVYVGFGSIFGRDPDRVTRVVVDAIKAVGVRAILARGWGGLEPGQVNLPETILQLDTAPHDWLFPRVAAVVHHGGCGTTAAGLRAGRPTIICPFFGDQPFWGGRINELGVGPVPIPQKKLTVENLSAAIHQTLADATMQTRARALGDRIRSEDGITNAVHFIERWMRQPAVHQR